MFYVAFKCKSQTKVIKLNANTSDGNRLYIQDHSTSAFLNTYEYKPYMYDMNIVHNGPHFSKGYWTEINETFVIYRHC
jgi:hypothetical protein